jgi:hypothetical protein
MLYRVNWLKRARQIPWILILGLSCCVLHAPAGIAVQETVKLKIVAVNPSSEGVLNTKVRQDLPEEVRDIHVVDAGEMRVEFDQEKSVYYAIGDVSLEPKEMRTFEVTVKNVWMVSDDVISGVRDEVNQSLEALSNTKYSESASILYDKVMERVGEIETEQAKDMGIKKRIELYHSHANQLEELKSEVLSLGVLRRMESEESDGVRTAKFVIAATNPSSEPRSMTVRSVLPRVIKATDVIDKKGFTLLFDKSAESYALQRVDEFEARQEKRYEIEIRDIWYVPESELTFLREKTEKILAHFQNSEYADYGNQIGAFIYKTLDSIALLQEEVAGSEVLQDRIRAFVLNKQRHESAKKKFKELQDLLLEIPIKQSQTIIDQVKKSFKEIAKLLDVLNVGFKPNLSTTWWLILGVIAFLFIFATSFYVIWIGRLSKSPWGKKGGKAKAKAKGPAPQDAESGKTPEKAA